MKTWEERKWINNTEKIRWKVEKEDRKKGSPEERRKERKKGRREEVKLLKLVFIKNISVQKEFWFKNWMTDWLNKKIVK